MAFLAALLLNGCAGGPLSKIESSTALTSELPKELQDKFEVKDTTQAPPSRTEEAPAAQSLPPAPQPQVRPRKKLIKPTKDKSKPAVKEADLALDEHRSAPVPVAPQASVKPVSDEMPANGANGGPVVFPNRRPEKDPIWVGEKTVYEVGYFGMIAGSCALEVLPYKTISNRKVYHVKGHATTSSVFGLFYRLDDTIETFFDYEGIFSHRFHIALDESKQVRDALELNDSERAQTYYWNRWDKKEAGYTETKEYQPIPRFPQDTLSSLFYIRTLPLKDGEVYTFPVVSEGKNWEAVVTVVRREEMNTPMGRVRTVVVKPETKFQGVLKKQGDSFIWFTDDERRVLIKMEAKVKIGTVVAKLTKFQPGIRPGSAADPQSPQSQLEEVK